LQQLERSERGRGADALRLDVGESAIDQQPISGEQQDAAGLTSAGVSPVASRLAASGTGRARRRSAARRAQKFSTIAL
jgi:hypothetical protein